MRKKGFSLVEIVVTVAIMGILAGISFPMMHSVREKSRLREATEQIQQELWHAFLSARSQGAVFQVSAYKGENRFHCGKEDSHSSIQPAPCLTAEDEGDADVFLPKGITIQDTLCLQYHPPYGTLQSCAMGEDAQGAFVIVLKDKEQSRALRVYEKTGLMEIFATP